MSRLVINIEHTNDGKLAFGVQSDNADQQVALLQHQLANFQEQRENFVALEAKYEKAMADLAEAKADCHRLASALQKHEDAEKARLAQAKRRR